MSSQPNRTPAGFNPGAGLALDYPMSLGVFDKYADAQHAVDYLSDNEFPVQNVLIVGTDLKQLERITGRLTRARVIAGGALSGAWLGFFVGLVLALFDSGGVAPVSVLATVIFGVVFGAVWAMVGYSFTKGHRDFTSVSQVVATKYEVLCEHSVAARGRELLAQMDPMRAAQEQVRRAREAEAAAYAAAQGTEAPAPPAQTEEGPTRP